MIMQVAMMKRRFLQSGTWLIVGLYLIAALLYSLSVPVWEAPDESGHFAYIKHLRSERTLPIQGQHASGEAHQPPLYYVVAAIFSVPSDVTSSVGKWRRNPNFMWNASGGNDVNINILGTAQTIPFQGQSLALHLARLASVAMGAGTVYLVIRIGHYIFPERPEIGLLAGGLIALTPQFLFISGVLNNDNLLILCTTGTIWQTLQAINKPKQYRQWVFVGLWLSAAVMTKLTSVAIVALVGIMIFYVSWERRSWKILIRAAMITGGLLLLLTGWWFLRNQVLYGDPLGNTVYEQLFAANVRLGSLHWRDIRELVVVQFRSFWAVFGWMNILGPSWYYVGIYTVLALAVLGWVRAAVKRPFSPSQRQALIWLVLAMILQEIVILYVITRCNASCYQGRYLMPAIGPIMLLISIGVMTLLNAPWNHYLVGILSLFFLITAFWMPIAVISPAYTLMPESGWHAWVGTEQVQANFNNQFVLRSYSQERNETSLQIQIYWQTVTQPDFDYSTFVHLVDSSGQMVAQSDVGLGQSINYLPTNWAVGDMVMEIYSITFPDDLPSGTYQIRTGMYNWVSGKRLPVYVENNPVGDFVMLDETNMQ